MARPVRMNHPDTFYHVLSRGNERKEIFRMEKDYKKFKQTIARMVERFELEVHGYVLMSNHYHLLIRTRCANLSRAMQWLGLTYSIWFNLRHNRSGHLFQGRFKSFVIENDKYFAAMCLYIHRNPIRAGMVKNLLDYPWSSYHAYANPKKEKNEPWLTTTLVLGMHGGSRKRFVEAQTAYSDVESSLLDELRYGLILGEERFVEEWKERLQEEAHREKPQVRAVLKDQNISSVVETVLSKLRVEDGTSLLKPLRGEKRPDRDLAIYILCHLGVFTHRDIGRVFGVGYTSVSGALKRAGSYMDADKKIREKVVRILNDK
ncbi:MAG: transposase [Deltaproteobacteria bacterium]|nr:MAG: transposase [Deltaproteobacteria bacterium]